MPVTNLSRPLSRLIDLGYALWLRRSGAGSVDGTPIVGPEAVLATGEPRV